MTWIRKLATELAADLFTNGAGQQATRLMLELSDGGVLSRAAVVSRIATHLELEVLRLVESGPPNTSVSQNPA